MSIGGIHDEAALKRWLQGQLATPGVAPTAKPDISLVKAGPPSDEDFENPPGDGTAAYDSEGEALYVRANGEWLPA